MSDCSVCKKSSGQVRHKIACSDCKNPCHMSCVGLSKDDVDYIVTENQIWRCPSCTAARRKSMTAESVDESDVKNVLSEVLSKLNEASNDRKRIETEINKSFEFVHDQITEQKNAIRDQSSKLTEYLQLIESLRLENSNLKKKVTDLEVRLEYNEQYLRSNTLEIQGVPENIGEDVYEVVRKVGEALDMTIPRDAIDVCHHLGKKPEFDRPAGIIVKFVRREVKQTMLEKRRVKRNLNTKDVGYTQTAAVPVYINESLSPVKRRLLAAARTVKREKNYTFLWVLSGDGLPQEVCGVCRQHLDLSVTFKRQVSQVDLMLREHLASTTENERCVTPTITGDPLIEDGKKGTPPAGEGGEEVEKDQGAKEKSSDDGSDPNPSSGDCGGQEEEDDWAIAEPWPDLGESEEVNGGEIDEQRTGDETWISEETVDETEEMQMPLTHIKLEGGGTLLFSLSEEEQDENTNSINDLDLSCSDVDEDYQEEFKCPHCPKAFSSKRGVAGHQREHPEHSLRRRDRRRARDRNRIRDRRKPSEKLRRHKLLESLKNNSENTDEKCSQKNIQSVEQSNLGEDDSQTDEQKDGPRRSSRSTLGKAPERHVVPHYSCNKCERMYNDEAALENHIKMQHGTTYKCNHCGKKFMLKDSLEGHIRNSHLDTTAHLDIKRFREQSSLNNNQSMRNHERPRRNHNRPRKKTGHACDICGKSYENRSHLFSHMRSHKSTVHLCEICGKTVSLNTYPAHKRSHLNAESHEVFPCDLCGKKFNNKVSLRTHKNSYHGTMKFTCEMCGKQFTTMALMKHHQNIHSGKRDHACLLCGKAFTLKVTLKSHMRIHTGEMPYGCEHCGKHFTWKTTYRNHLATCKKVQNDVAARSEVVAQNSVQSVPSDASRSEMSRSNPVYVSPPPQPPPPPPAVPYMPHLPQELPLDYSEEAKYHAPIDYSEESKYRFLPISIPDTKGFPHMLNLREDIKYPYQQPLNFSGDVKLYRDVKSPV